MKYRGLGLCALSYYIDSTWVHDLCPETSEPEDRINLIRDFFKSSRLAIDFYFSNRRQVIGSLPGTIEAGNDRSKGLLMS
jgi:hypothetical protein